MTEIMKINSVYGYIEIPKIKVRNGKRYKYSTVNSDIEFAKIFAKMLREVHKNVGVITATTTVKKGKFKGRKLGIIYIRKKKKWLYGNKFRKNIIW